VPTCVSADDPARYPRAVYRDLVLEWERRYVETIHSMGALVRLHICGNTNDLFAPLAGIGVDIMDLDYMAVVADAREQMGPRQLLSGNVDPVRVMKDGTPARVTEALEQCFADAGGRYYATCAGCEIPRGTPPENLKAMRDFARGHRE